MVKARWFGEEKKKLCLAHQQLANDSSTQLSVETSVNSFQTNTIISVFEPNVSYYSRLGRVIVVYNKKLNTWHCPCAKVHHSCLHKYIAKWHLFQTERELFWKVFSREESAHQKKHSFREEQCLRWPSFVSTSRSETETNVGVHSTGKEDPCCSTRQYTSTITRKRRPQIYFSRPNYLSEMPRCCPPHWPCSDYKEAEILTSWALLKVGCSYQYGHVQCNLIMVLNYRCVNLQQAVSTLRNVLSLPIPRVERPTPQL